MKVMQKNMLEFMDEGDMRFVIPAYQRLYSWNETQCEELWLDILRAARGKRNHFLGTVLYNVTRNGKTPDHIEIIDGQQRLTKRVSRHPCPGKIPGISSPVLSCRYVRCRNAHLALSRHRQG